MEEVDQIIIHTLRQIGCDIEDDVTTLKEFTTELVVEGVVRCLKFISPDLELSVHVPPNMVARYNLGMALANACIECGYKGDLGYQTFLYSNENEMRRIFMFLFEKLPKESEKAVDEPLGMSIIIERTISLDLAEHLKQPWLPCYCKVGGVRKSAGNWWREDYSDCQTLKTSPLYVPNKHSDSKNQSKRVIPVLWEQVSSRRELAPSIFETNVSALAAQQELEAELNQAGLMSKVSKQEYKQRKKEKVLKRIADALKQALSSTDQPKTDFKKLLESISEADQKASPRIKGSRFTRTEKLQFAKEEDRREMPKEILRGSGDIVRQNTEEQLKKKAEDEIQELKEEIARIAQTSERLENQGKQISASIQQMSEDIANQELKNEQLESKVQLERKALALLPDSENNIAKLQARIDASAQKLLSLSAHWEKHRAPLIDQFRQLKEMSSKRLSETQQKLEEMKVMKEKMKEISEQTRNKEELHKQLVSEYERLTKDVNRSAYTKRITEIVGNIKKQKEEIDKVLVDTKSLQKEINQLTGKLDRTFTVTDELIFKDAKKDEAVRRAYKYLASVHENSNQLLSAVEETGAILREVRDLEDQIEQESQKKVVANLERITADYKQMKQENASLMSQLKEQ